MKILILLCCVWLASAGTVPEKCDGVTFDGKYYDKEVLLKARLADNFSYAKSTNTLYFSYANPINMTEEHFIGVAYLNLDTKEFRDMPEVSAGSTTGINTKTDEVYVAGDNGILKVNPQTNKAEPYIAEGLNIYYIYFDNILFYITWPNFEGYSYDGHINQKASSNVTVQKFIGDGENYYFDNESGLFRMLKGKVETAEKLADADDTNYIVYAKDNNKKIYVLRNDGVYVPNVQEKKLDKVANLEQVRGLAFDKDNNVIYSDVDYIYKLTPSQAKCPPA